MNRKLKISLLFALVISSINFIHDDFLQALDIKEKVSIGRQHSLALKKDGTVWAWGENSSGQLGINNTIDQNVPVQVLGVDGIGFLENIIDISAGTDHSIALQGDGTIWIWGANSSGQLGDSTTSGKRTPIKVPGITNVIEISAGRGFTHIVKSDGSIWSWGFGSNGELGLGTTTSSLSPVKVKGVNGTGFLSNIIDVSTGEEHVMALKDDGTVYAWGLNGSGRLGINSTIKKNTPVKVVNETNTGDLLNIKEISAGYNHSMALAQDGSLYVWGNNDAGQLGIGTYISKNKPFKIISFIGVKEISAGIAFSSAIKTDGSLWSWGVNGEGELGIGGFVDKNNPTQVVNEDGTNFLTNVTSVSIGDVHSVASTSDGSVYAWGDATSGKLGNAVNVGFFDKPVKIIDFDIVGEVPDVGIDAGQFIISNITNAITFEDYTLGVPEESLTIKDPFSFSIEDFRGTLSGWKVNFKISDFTNGTDELIEPILTSNCVNGLVFDTDGTGVKTGINAPIINEFTCSNGNIPFNTEFSLITAEASIDTTGKHIFEFPKEFLSLTFSNTSKFGNYTGDLTFTLTAGP